MSAALLPDSTQCCVPCDDVVTVQTPGPAGEDGQDGAAGANGLNAFTSTTAAFVMPAEGATVVVSVGSSAFAVLGQILFVQNAGEMQVSAIPGSTSLTLLNLENTGTSAYLTNAAPGTNIASGSKVCPGGRQGPAGVVVGAMDDDALNAVLPDARTNLGLGTMATQNASAVAITGGAISGITDLPVADGGTGASTAANARTNLGLVIGTNVQAQDATLQSISALGSAADRLAYTTALDTWAEAIITAQGRAILDDADSAAQRTTIGVQRTPQDLLVYEHQALTTVAGGDFTSGAWRTVPLSTEVVDTGGHGAIAASIITLQPGTYRFRGRVCGFDVDNFQSRLFNVDTASVIAYGEVARAAAADDVQIYSCVRGRFTLAVATQVRLEAQCQTTNAGDGFGFPGSFGGTEIYSSLELEREAG